MRRSVRCRIGEMVRGGTRIYVEGELKRGRTKSDIAVTLYLEWRLCLGSIVRSMLYCELC